MRASPTVLLERPGAVDAALTPSTPGGPIERLAFKPNRARLGWERVASSQQDALRTTFLFGPRSPLALRLEPMGKGVADQLAALERQPVRLDGGVWYPMDRKRFLEARGAPVPGGLIYG